MQTSHRLGSVEGNPIRYVDPSGHKADDNLIAKLTGGFSIAAKIGDYKNFNFQNARGALQYFDSGFDNNHGQKQRKKDSIIRKPFHWLGEKTGLTKLDKWWKSQQNSYEEPFERRAIKNSILINVCLSFSTRSRECLGTAMLYAGDYFIQKGKFADAKWDPTSSSKSKQNFSQSNNLEDLEEPELIVISLEFYNNGNVCVRKDDDFACENVNNRRQK